MATCKLKKGDKIYECRYREGTLIELITDPILEIQPGGSHYWHWQAKIVSTGQIIDYGISEEAPAYGPKLFRKNMYEVGYENAEPVLPPFDNGNSDSQAMPNRISTAINTTIDAANTPRKRFMLKTSINELTAIKYTTGKNDGN